MMLKKEMTRRLKHLEKMYEEIWKRPDHKKRSKYRSNKITQTIEEKLGQLEKKKKYL